MDWKLTRNAIGEPEIDEFHDDPDDGLLPSYSLLQDLVEAGEAEELAEGVYWLPKTSREKLI
jgi:hypothetical protein